MNLAKNGKISFKGILLFWVQQLAAGILALNGYDINFSQVLSVEYIVGVLLEMLPSLGVCVFGARFHYNTFLVSNRMVG